MELGRLLRDEGITPAMIQSNRGLLVNAMKTTLEHQTFPAESIPESYATAPEYRIDSITSSSITQPINASSLGLPPVLSPMSILGSAPPPSAGFTDLFLERQNNAASSLDQKENVDDGMRSLLQGMSREELDEGYQQDDIDDVELGDDKEKGELEEIPLPYEEAMRILEDKVDDVELGDDKEKGKLQEIPLPYEEVMRILES